MDSSRQSPAAVVSKSEISLNDPINNGLSIFATDISSKIRFLKELKLREKPVQPLVLVPRLEHLLGSPFLRELRLRGSLKVLQANCKPKPKRKKLDIFQIIPADANKTTTSNLTKKILMTEIRCIGKNPKNYTKIKSNKTSNNAVNNNNNNNINNNDNKVNDNYEHNKNGATIDNINKSTKNIPDINRASKSSIDIRPATDSIPSVSPTSNNIPDSKPATDFTDIPDVNISMTPPSCKDSLNDYNSTENSGLNSAYSNISSNNYSKREVHDDFINGNISSSVSNSNNNINSGSNSSLTTTTVITSTSSCSIYNIESCNNNSENTRTAKSIYNDHNTENKNCTKTPTLNENDNAVQKIPETPKMNSEIQNQDEKMNSTQTLPVNPNHSAVQTKNDSESFINTNHKLELELHDEKVAHDHCTDSETSSAITPLRSRSHSPSSSDCTLDGSTSPVKFPVMGNIFSSSSSDSEKSGSTSKESKAKEPVNKVCNVGKRQDFVCKQKGSETGSGSSGGGGGIPKIILYVKGKGPDKQYTCARNTSKTENIAIKPVNMDDDSKSDSSNNSIPSQSVSKHEKRPEKISKHKLDSGNYEGKKKRHKSLTEGKENHIKIFDSVNAEQLDCPKSVVSEKIETIASIIRKGGHDSNDSFSDSLPDLERISESDSSNCPQRKNSTPCDTLTDTKSGINCDKKIRSATSKKVSEEKEKFNSSNKPSKLSLNHKYLGKPTAHVEPYVAEPTLRSSSRKGKGFYDEDIPFPLEQDEVVGTYEEEDNSEIPVLNEFNNLIIPPPPKWKNSFKTTTSLDSKNQHRNNHSKKTSKCAAQFAYYQVLRKLNICICRPLSNKESLKYSKCPLHHKAPSLAQLDESNTIVAENKFENKFKKLTMRKKRDVNGKLRQSNKITKHNDGEGRNNNHKDFKSKSLRDNLHLKFSDPCKLKKREYFTPNLLREISKHGNAAKKKFDFCPIQSLRMKKNNNLPGLQSLETKQRPRSLSIDSALSLFKVRVEDSALMFPLKRSSSLINFGRNDYPVYDTLSKLKQSKITQPPTSPDYCSSSKKSDFHLSKKDESNDNIETNTDKNNVEDKLQTSITDEDKCKEHCHELNADSEGCPNHNKSELLKHSPSTPITSPEKEKGSSPKPKIEKKRHSKNKEEKEPKSGKKVKKLKISLLTATKSGNSSPKQEELTGDASSTVKKVKKKMPTKKKLIGEDFKEALEEQILKFHELEKGRRLAQEIPGFNWLEEKIRNASTTTSSATCTASKTVTGSGESGTLPSSKPPSGRSLSWSSTTEVTLERKEPPELRPISEVLPTSKDHGLTPTSSNLGRKLYSFSFRTTTLDQLPSLVTSQSSDVMNVSAENVVPEATNNNCNLVTNVSSNKSTEFPSVFHQREEKRCTPAEKPRQLMRHSSYEERSNAPKNKAFMHLQTAVTAMLPTSKALPKRQIIPPSLHVLPTPISSTSSSIVADKSNIYPQKNFSVSSSSQSLTTISKPSTTSTVSTQNSISAVQNLVFSSIEQAPPALSVPHTSISFTSHTSTFSVSNNSVISTKSKLTIPVPNTLSISGIHNSVSSAYPNSSTLSMPQISPPLTQPNSASELYSVTSHSKQNKSIINESRSSNSTISCSQLINSKVTTNTSPSNCFSFPHPHNFTAFHSNQNSVAENSINSPQPNSPITPLTISLNNPDSENNMTSTNLSGKANYQGDNESSNLAIAEQMRSVTKEKTVHSNILKSLTTPTTSSSQSLSNATLSRPALNIVTAVSEEMSLQETCLPSQNPPELPSNKHSSQEEERCKKATFKTKKMSASSEQNRSTPSPPFTPKLSILKEAFKNKLSVLHYDEGESNRSHDSEGSTGFKEVKSSANAKNSKEGDDINSESLEASETVSKEPDKKARANTGEKEKPVLISIPETLPSIESVLHGINVNESLEENILGQGTKKEYETPSLIAALYEELLRTRQEVEKLRKIQEQMLNTDSIKKHSESQAAAATTPPILIQKEDIQPIITDSSTAPIKDTVDKDEPPIIDITKEEESSLNKEHCAASNSISSNIAEQSLQMKENISTHKPTENSATSQEENIAVESNISSRARIAENHKKRSSQDDFLSEEFSNPFKKLRNDEEGTFNAIVSSQHPQTETNRMPSFRNQSCLRDILGISNSELDVVPIKDKVTFQSILNQHVDSRKEYSEEVYQNNLNRSFSTRPETVIVTSQPKVVVTEGGPSNVSVAELSRQVPHSPLTSMPGLIPTNSMSQGRHRLLSVHEENGCESEPPSNVPTSSSNSGLMPFPKTNILSTNLTKTDQSWLQAYQNRVTQENRASKQQSNMTPREHHQEQQQKHLLLQQQQQQVRAANAISNIPTLNQSTKIVPERRFSVQRSPKPLESCTEEEKRHYMPQYISNQRDVMDKSGPTLSSNISCNKTISTSPQMFQPKIIIPPNDKNNTVSPSSSTAASSLEWPPGHSITSQESVVSPRPLLASSSNSSSYSLIKRPSAFAPSQGFNNYRQNSNNRLVEIFPVGHSMNGHVGSSLSQPHHHHHLPNQTKSTSSFHLMHQQQQHPSQQDHFVTQQMKQKAAEKTMTNQNSNQRMNIPLQIQAKIHQNPPSQFYPSQIPFSKGSTSSNHPTQTMSLQKHQQPQQSVPPPNAVLQPHSLPPHSIPSQFHNVPSQLRPGIQTAENLQQIGAYHEDHPTSISSPSQSHVVNSVPKPRPNNSVSHSQSYPNKPTYKVVPKPQISPTAHNNYLHNNSSNIPAHLQPLSTYRSSRVPVSNPSHHQPSNQCRGNLQLQMYQASSLNKTAMMSPFKLAPQPDLSSSVKHDNPLSDVQRMQLYPHHPIGGETHQDHHHQQTHQQPHMMPVYHQRYPAVVVDSGDYGATSSTPSPNKKKCLVCPQSAQFLCSGCKTAWYCSKECQRQHWTQHSSNCSPRRQS